MNSARLLARFLRYVQIDTMANDQVECYPSSPGQIELGHLLADELRPWAWPTSNTTRKAWSTPPSRRPFPRRYPPSP